MPRSTPAPFWTRNGAALYLGDVRTCLRELPARSVHCVITSPPYWGLRDYGTGTWEGGSADCDHRKGKVNHYDPRSTLVGTTTTQNHSQESAAVNGVCRKCGAKRADNQIGMEKIPDCLGWATGKQCGACFVCHLVEVFAEVRRVLRDDGTVWLNLGDTFDGGQGMVPAAVAMALRSDGWKLVQDIIWYSPNKMPESVQNRCTKSHEHIFLLAKGDGYYFDSVAIEEPTTTTSGGGFCNKAGLKRAGTELAPNGKADFVMSDSKNKRDVWIVPTQGYPGAHFATFSPRLITPCILAGTSEHGCCAACGRPYERVVAKTKAEVDFDKDSSGRGCRDRSPATKETIGWNKMCGCQTDDVVPAVVLDPFVGSGTTVATSLQLGRHGVGIDLSETYLRDNAIPRINDAINGPVSRKVTVAFMPGTMPPPQILD